MQGHFLEAQENKFFVKIGKLYIPKAYKMWALHVVGSLRGFHIYYIHK